MSRGAIARRVNSRFEILTHLGRHPNIAGAATVSSAHDRFTIEPWLIWIGAGALYIKNVPAPF
jgi:hypothetical protein